MTSRASSARRSPATSRPASPSTGRRNCVPACAETEFDPPGPIEPIKATGGIAYRWDQFEGDDALRSAVTSQLLTAIRVPCSTEGFTLPPPKARKAQAGGGTV